MALYIPERLVKQVDRERPKDFARAPSNPADPAKWEEMADDGPLYRVLHAKVTYTRPARDKDGKWGVRGAGAFEDRTLCTAREFGPGAEIQRLIDLRAIRPATPDEIDKAKQGIDVVEVDGQDRPTKIAAPPAKPGDRKGDK